MKPFRDFTGAYAEHPLPKSQFRFGLGLCLAGYGTGAVIRFHATKEIMLLRISLRTKRNASHKKNIL
jgi:hypothetical protein